MPVSLRLPDDLSQRLSSLAAQRLLDVRAGRSMPHSIDDVERILPERQQPEMQEREPQMFGVVDPMAIPYGE